MKTKCLDVKNGEVLDKKFPFLEVQSKFLSQMPAMFHYNVISQILIHIYINLQTIQFFVYPSFLFHFVFLVHFDLIIMEAMNYLKWFYQR